MSVLMNLAIFPTDKGDSVGVYVSEVINYIQKSGVKYKLNSMGTTIETETMEEALSIIQGAYEILNMHSSRIYCNLTMDIRKGKSNRMEQKIESIEKHIGPISK